ncbi:MAG: hypothetical protein LBD24_06460 [Spirochaetaceae bacterium]|jgi:hypothetical protein|nr:hypothetical protein [Spirochaetaceae bacterium]
MYGITRTYQRLGLAAFTLFVAAFPLLRPCAAFSETFLANIDPYWSFLWTGSWGKTMEQRGDASVYWRDFSLRAQVIDKRPAFFWEDFESGNTGNTAFSGGLYHKKTGSRLLYGIMREEGLPARLRGLWNRSPPFAENRKNAPGDLATQASATKSPETYLYLASPRWGMFRAFGSVLLDTEVNPSASGGFDLALTPRSVLRLEGFYTGKELRPRAASSWFSNAPPLPARDFRLYALSAVYSGAAFGLAADGAYSDTFAYGRDLYANLGIRLGNRPWRLSLAAERAGARFTGRDGAPTGAGFRLGTRLEFYGKKSEFFQLGASLYAEEAGGPFLKSSAALSYRFPTTVFGRFPLKPARVSLGLSRNAADFILDDRTGTVEDKAEGALGITLGPVRSLFSCAVFGTSEPDGQPPPFPLPEDSLRFRSAKVTGELSYTLGIFQFKVKSGCLFKEEPRWDVSFHAAALGKPGRLALTVTSPHFPVEWHYTVSWRLSKSAAPSPTASAWPPVASK